MSGRRRGKGCKRCGGAEDFACFKVVGYEDGAALPSEPSHYLCDDCRDFIEFGDTGASEWSEFGWNEALVIA